MTNIIKRTTLMVRDVEKAAIWYETIFGMTRWMDVPFTLSGTQLAAGNFGAGVWERWEIHPFTPAAGEWIGGKTW